MKISARLSGVFAGVFFVLSSQTLASGPGIEVTTELLPSGAMQLRVPLPFGSPSVRVAKDGSSQSVGIDQLLTTIEGGMPGVPVKTLRLLLPVGKRVDFAALEKVVGSEEKGMITRNTSNVPLSWPRELAKSPELGALSLGGQAYPLEQVVVNHQRLHGRDIAVVNVYPVQVQGDQKSFSVLQTAEVVLSLEDTATAHEFSRPRLQRELEELRAFVDNPEALENVEATATLADAYDYLIVSAEPFISFHGANDLEAFRAHLQGQGRRSKVVSLTDIEANTAGADRAAKIRNFIKGEYEQSGIQFVLLAGDGDMSGSGAIIPARKMWSKINAYTGSWQIVEENIAADLYYSNLDGDFNGNGNSKWGEPTDGVGGGDVDLVSEVVVGRWPMKTTGELQNIVRKTIWMSVTPQLRSSLLMGEGLFPELNLYGDDYMNQLVGQCTDHAFTTNGYGPEWTQDHLYDRGGSWTGTSAQSKINGGNFSMINHLGHSNTTYNMRMSSSSISRFTNPKPFFFYTQGCFPGDFTANDCFVEKLLRHSNGASAAIANTNYGLGPEDPNPTTTVTPGASQMLHRRFIDAVFSQEVRSLAAGNQYSKEQFLGFAGAQEMRWVMWDANFFGDPSLKLSY